MKLLSKTLCIILLSASVAFAADPAGLAVYPPNKIMGFRGLDTRSTAPLLPDGRSVDLQNVKLSSAYDLRQRYGYSVINQSADDPYLTDIFITGIFGAKYSTGTDRTFIFIGNKIKYDNGNEWTEVGNYFDTPTITANKNYQFQCIMALDYGVCTNDQDVPLKLSSTPAKSSLSFTGLSNAVTKTKALAWYRNYLIVGNTYEGSTEYPTRFRWSNVGTIETWTDADYVDIATYAGDEIIGFAELYGDLYIFLKKSIWKASLVGGDDIFVFTKVIDGVGGIARDSIKTLNLSENRSVIIFLTEQKKIYVFNGTTIMDIGGTIQDTLDNLNATRLQYAVGTFDGTSYFLSATTGSNTSNDTLYELQTEIVEWSKHTQIDANAMAQVEESASVIKTYFGNYDGFVYWLDNPDNKNDVDGATGIVDSVGVTSISTYITDAQVILDLTLTDGDYAGAILRITGGTASGEERVILTDIETGVVITTAFSTTPDSTSLYSIGDIDAYYETKWYDFGNASAEKNFLGMLFWAEEASSNEVDVYYYKDFEDVLGSESISLAPATASLWDSAIWDESVWASTGDKIYTHKSSGMGNFIKYKFENNDIDETFHIYGYSMIGQVIGTKQ